MANRVAIGTITLLIGTGLFLGMTVVPSLDGDLLDSGATGEVVATHTTMHFDRVGRPTVVGEVINRKGRPISDVRVQVTFYHKGKPIANVTDSPLGIPLASEAKAPFVVRMPDTSTKPTDYEITVSYRKEETRRYDGLVVTGSEVSDEAQDRIVVMGTIKNNGNEIIRAQVVVTFYNENGSVIGARTVRPSPATLQPGESAVFRAQFRTLGNLPSRARDFHRFEVSVNRIGDADQSQNIQN